MIVNPLILLKIKACTIVIARKSTFKNAIQNHSKVKCEQPELKLLFISYMSVYLYVLCHVYVVKYYA